MNTEPCEPTKVEEPKPTLSDFIQEFETKKKQSSVRPRVKKSLRRKQTDATSVLSSQQIPNMRSMIRSGELLHKIIKDNPDKPLNLSSIDFKRKYRIQDIMSNKGFGKLSFASHRPSKAPSVNPLSTLQSTIDIYKQPSKMQVKTLNSSKLSINFDTFSRNHLPNQKLHTDSSNQPFISFRESLRCNDVISDSLSLNASQRQPGMQF